MLIFMFLLFPVVLAGYFIKTRNPKEIIPAFIGLMSAVLLCAFKTFFLYAHRVIPYEIGSNVVYFLVRQSLLPVVVMYGIYLIFSRDDWEFKTDSFCPLFLTFYMIYLPYSIVSTAEGLYSGFALFVKPVIYVIMVLQCSYIARKIFSFVQAKKIGFVILFVIFGLAYLVLPALMDSLAVIGEYGLINCLLIVVYCLIPVIIYSLPVFKNLRKEK